jgi:hypothetical protein
VQLVSAAALIGREVLGPRGRHLGFIDYILFDVATGRVRDVVLVPAGAISPNGDFLGLAWKTLEQPLSASWKPIRTRVTPAVVASAPRIDAAQIFGEAHPERIPDAFSAKAMGVRHQLLASPSPDRGLLSRPVISAQNLEALTIEDGMHGVAAVDRIVIDPGAGRIAYLVAIPFAEDVGPALIAVPFEGLHYSAADATYQVALKGGLHPADPNSLLTANLGERTIDRGAVRELFSGYDAKPYWSKSSAEAPQVSAKKPKSLHTTSG